MFGAYDLTTSEIQNDLTTLDPRLILGGQNKYTTSETRTFTQARFSTSGLSLVTRTMYIKQRFSLDSVFQVPHCQFKSYNMSTRQAEIHNCHMHVIK